MVSSPSAAAQAAENEKRRKPQHSMEKAKANHLTRQLQVRLQYARLKVEHGWQKQNLNEVENLYFHNSHLRGGKPALSVSTQQPIMMTQPSLTPIASSSVLPLPIPPTQPQNIGSMQNTSFHNNIPPPTAITEPENPQQDIAQASQRFVPAATSPVAISDPSINNVNHSLGDSMHVDNPATTITPSIRPEILTSLPPVVHDPIPTIPTIPTPTTTLSLLSPQSPTSSTNPSFTNHYAALKIPRTRNNKHPAGPKGAHQNLTAKEMLDFASTSTLTYDSFWSTHSASAPPSRSPRPVLTPASGMDGQVGMAPAFNSGLFANGFSAIDLSQFVNISFNPASTTVATSAEHSRSVAP